MTPNVTVRAVLDTNVLLDWLVFRNPEIDPLVSALHTRQLEWVATHAMRVELDRVLGYTAVAARLPDTAAIDAAWQAHAVMLDSAPRAPMRCRDDDDQKFIDLAVAARARWLITKDRDLLRLSKRALAWGVRVAPTSAWQLIEAD
jgi:putative PIN family toxin of toxin-antitoxin system